MPGRAWGAALLLAVLVAGCDLTEPVPPVERLLVVHGVIELGQPEAFVSLAWTDTAWVGASGATVTITSSDGHVFTGVENVRFTGPYADTTAHVPGSYRFVPDSVGASFTRGTTYTLHVQTADGTIADAVTTTPNAEPDSSCSSGPYPSDLFWHPDTIRLSWPRVAGARRYEVSVGRDGSYMGYGRTVQGWTMFTDTSFAIAADAKMLDGGSRIFPEGEYAPLVVLAVDDNYYEYLRIVADPFAGAPPTRVVGGLGMFGSVVPVRCVIVLL